ncbi:isochorismatase family cysteine hydrolase [Actinoplanes sp. NPDC023936]|uniref:cysteine hydrolase family protein n=1 Tax=Actinoplanes sp. NPDC023936 TaxID=3154910 RepID=UPI0033D663AA
MNYLAPRWGSSALIVIDMQADFAEGGATPIPGTAAVTPRVAQLADAYRRAGRPIVHIVRLYPPGSSDVDLLRRAAVEGGAQMVAPGTPGSAILAGLAGPDPLPIDAATLLAGHPQPVGPGRIGPGTTEPGRTGPDTTKPRTTGPGTTGPGTTEPGTIGSDEIALFKPRWGAFYRTPLESWLRDRDVDTVVVAGCNLPNCPRATLFEASERDFRTVLATDAVSQATPERLADLAGIGVTLLTTAEITAR